MDELIDLFANQPLLGLTVLAVLAAMLGWRLQHTSPRTAHGLRSAGYLGMAAALLLTVAQAAHRADRSEAAMLMASTPEVAVAGEETRIPIDASGHYWVTAQVNGREAEFMIDTGATYTSFTGQTARALGLAPTPGRMPSEFDTANGIALGRFTVLDSLSFGTVRARNLEAVIMVDDDGDTNVIGMNLLSRLKRWQVEDGTLTLVPAGS